MTPEQWREVSRVFQDALAVEPDQRDVFVAGACPGDDHQAAEVKRLLDAHARAGADFDEPVPVPPDFVRRLSPGRCIATYEIRSLLGVGGMGEVYRALDLQLGREVAMKVLPAEALTDPDRHARFAREARALAALNHPNVGSIYGLVDAEGVQALVLELIDGETLAERLTRGALSLGDALTIAAQVADGLDAAHERGIVHRDLKPSNITLTARGDAKILDFGIATVTSDGTADDVGDDRSTLEETSSGLLGTAAYMSPEQVRRTRVDKRTDIWALGCVLFEMLTGQAAFKGRSPAEVVSAILSSEPDWVALGRHAPRGVERFVRRCLQKDPARRLRDIGDARQELGELLAHGPGELGGGAGPPAASVAPRRHALALTAPLAVAIASLVWLAGRQPAPPALDTGTVTQITAYGLSETSPALSPDGQFLAFVSDHAGTPDVWLRRVSGGALVRLTDDARVETDVIFSADGNQVLFVADEAGVPVIWKVGALGGEQRKVMEGGRAPVPSPDGRQLAYLTDTVSGEWELAVVALDGSARRVVVAGRGNRPLNRASWSPDAQRLAYAGFDAFSGSNLFVIDVHSGVRRQVTRFTRSGEGVVGGAWMPDGRRVIVTYLAGAQPLLALAELGVIDASSGALVRLTRQPMTGFGMPSVSADGRRVVAAVTRPVREVWRVPLSSGDPEVNGRAAEAILPSRVAPFWASATRDGYRLLFGSPLTGRFGLWLADLDAPDGLRPVTDLSTGTVTHSAMSPDGTRVAFAWARDGAADVWVQHVDGTGLRQLTRGPEADVWPAWSPDGQWVVFSTERSGRPETWQVSLDGTRTARMLDGGFRGDWAARPDGHGTWIATSMAIGRAPASSEGNGVRLVDVERQTPLWQMALPGSQVSQPRFSPDGRTVSVALIAGERRSTIICVDAARGTRRTVAQLPFRVSFGADWTDGGASVIVNRNDVESHVVLFEGPPGTH